MKLPLLGALCALALSLVGCASPQLAVPLDAASLANKSDRIGVAMTPMPKVDTSLPGASCLLCIAVASAANSKLTTHANALPLEDLPRLKEQVAEKLRKKGSAVVVIADDLDVASLPDAPVKGTNIAKKDFSSLQQKYKIDKLVVLTVGGVGFLRNYSSYFPTSDPKGWLAGIGYMVDLRSNAYQWYLPVNVSKSAEGAWDEPPEFPALTNAYYQALELAKDSFLAPFDE